MIGPSRPPDHLWNPLRRRAAGSGESPGCRGRGLARPALRATGCAKRVTCAPPRTTRDGRMFEIDLPAIVGAGSHQGFGGPTQVNSLSMP